MLTDRIGEDILFWDLDSVQAAHHRVRIATYWAQHATQMRNRVHRERRRERRVIVNLCILAGAAILLSVASSAFEAYAAMVSAVICG